ncbi:hypothetical protein [Actinocorallia longicatena]|uniref:Uncharacterized protein n=1 Tax=Actinocorallia longicatena TaxID=111803 RepID=A0ABP6QI21_9ACTN
MSGKLKPKKDRSAEYKKKPKKDLKKKKGSGLGGRMDAIKKSRSTDVLVTDSTPGSVGGDLIPKVKGTTAPVVLPLLTNVAPELPMLLDPGPVVVPPSRTPWQVAQHPLTDGQKVKLSPFVRVKEGRISALAVGRMRTPSPFGSKMGDHTAAWTTVVDDMQALVHGKTVAEACAALAERQLHAEEWTGKPDSVGMRLWNSLEERDRDARKPVLETYASEVRSALQNPQTAEGLAKAIAHHLAYLNFLPYATVPAKGKTGSKGSGEGSARAAVLAVDMRLEAERQRAEMLEAEKLPQNKAKKEAREKREKEASDLAADIERRMQKLETKEETLARHKREEEAAAERERTFLPRAHEGLWKLFSLEAVVREARLERVVMPTKHQDLVKKVDKAREVSAKALELSNQFSISEEMVKAALQESKDKNRRKSAKTDKKRTPAPLERRKSTALFKPVLGLPAFNKGLADLKTLGDDLGDMRYSGYQVLADTSTDGAAIYQKMAEVAGAKTKTVGATKEVLRLAGQLKEEGDDLKSLYTDLNTDPGVLEDEAALMLGQLLHEHQSRMVRNYPVAVDKTGFLGKDPATTATAQLREFIRSATYRNELGKDVRVFDRVEKEALDRLVEKVEKVHRDLGKIAPPAEPNRWVATAKTADIVVTFPNASKINIQGRAAAPSGVEGMGSHTTAWLTEVQAIEKAVAAHGKAKVGAVLKQQTREELGGELMTGLAALLPADQLDAGQLGELFDAALAVLESEAPEDTVRNYLAFRNLMPYATVDAGDRGGHGESRDGTIDEVFDKDSLNAALQQKIDELVQPALTGTLKSMTDAATVLRTTLDATAPKPLVLAFPADLVLGGAPPPQAGPPEPNWNSHPELKAAVEAAIASLNGTADSMRTAGENGTLDGRTIGNGMFDVRYREHTRVFKAARS